jgi:DNA-binding SARP family transcriptional activator/WD40 repeat protein
MDHEPLWTYGARMDVGVLGPLQVADETGEIRLPGAKERTLLALLASRVDHVVALDDLVDALWPDEPPRTAIRTLQVYVARLRSALARDGATGESVIVTAGRGYRLALDPMAVDANRFCSLVELGRSALAEGQASVAADSFTQALGLWRGPAFSGFEDSGFGRSEARRLDELRMTAQEGAWAARTAAGDARGVIPELEGHVTAHPLREPAWALLVRAHAAADDQAAALATIERARGVLAEELGVDPGDELRALQSRVLAQDPALRPRGTLPPELVPPGTPFVGRAAELSELHAHLTSSREGPGRRVLIHGDPGSGRWRLASALAVAAQSDGVPVVVGAKPAAGAVLRVIDLRLDPSTSVPDPGLHELQLVVAGALPAGMAFDARVEVGPLSVRDVRELLAGHARGRVDDSTLTGAAEQVHAASAGKAAGVQRLAISWVRDQVSRRVAERTQVGSGSAAAHVADRQALAEDVELWSVLQPDPGSDLDSCPWRGLSAYAEEDAPWFAGRERITAELVARVAVDRALLLVGASGSGKSSLLRAGLLAALAAGALPDSSSWVRISMRPGEHPMRELTRAALSGAAATGPDRVADLLSRSLDGRGGAERVLLVVDQFEECWTVCTDPGERDAFLDALAEVATTQMPVSVVIAVRADHAGSIAGHPGISGALAGQAVFVGPMVEGELRRAIEGPARRAGLSLDTGLADALVADTLAEPGGLPLLSTALTALWEQRDGRRLTLAAYATSGGVGAAIAHLAEQAYADLDEAHRGAARILLRRLAGPGQGDGVVRRRVDLAELAALPDPRVRACVDPLAVARLLTVSDGHVEVAHEALFRSWPRLREWLAEDATARDIQRRLTSAAADWERDDHDPAQLWAGARLSAATDLAARAPEELTGTEVAFIEASTARLDVERTEAEERARSAQQQNSRLRRLLAGLGITLTVALLAGALAVASRQEAQARGVTATAQRLAATALSEDYLAERLLTAVEAVRTEESAQTVGALLSVLDQSSAALHRFGARYRLLELDTAPGGNLGYSAESSEDVISVNLTTGETRVLWSEPAANNQFLRVSPDGDQVAFIRGSWDGEPPRLLVLDAASGEEVWALPIDRTTFILAGLDWTGPGELALAATTGLVRYRVGSDEPVGGVAWEPTPGTEGALLARVDDRRMLLFRGGPGAARLIDHTSGEVTTLDTIGSDGIVSPDGQYVVTQPEDPGPVHIVDLARPTEPGRTISFDGSLSTAHFSPDGTTLALGDRTGDIVVVDVASLIPRETLRGHVGMVMGLAISPDGQTLWSAGRDADLIAWDLGGQRRLQRTRELPARSLLGQVSDDGSIAVTWQLGAPPEVPHTSTVVDSAANTVAFGPLPGGEVNAIIHAVSPDGATVVVALEYGPQTSNGPLHIYDVPSGQLRAEVPLPWVAGGISITPDNRLAVVGGQRGAAVVDLVAGTVIRQRDLPELLRDQYPVEVSPDGSLFAFGREDEILILDTATLADVSSWQAEPYDNPLGLAWLDGGATLAHGGVGGQLAFRSIPDGEPIGEPREISPGFTLDLATNTDATRLATLGSDGEMILWDPATRQAVGEPLTPLGGQQSHGWVWFGSDDEGEFIEAQYENARAVRYPIATDTLIARACAIAGREPTMAEWQSMHGDIPQRPTCGTLTEGDLIAAD